MAWYLNTPPRNDSEKVYFVIQPQESLRTIAARLENHNIIRSSLFMRILAQKDNRDRLMQSGNYAIPTTMTTHQTIAFLTTGRQLLVRVTIPEGLTIQKIADIFHAQGVTPKDDFVHYAQTSDTITQYNIPSETLEGYLFPDTYFFTQDQSAEEVISQMVAGFYANIEMRFPETESMDSVELHRLITLASLIEKEYLDAVDAPLISSVFHNRLARNMRLEACSTVVYIITEIEKKPHPTRLYFADLERNSPYNTYRALGLPPSPIASPGNVAINAALYPTESAYLFFVLESDDSTKHTFSETFTEHNRARTIFLRSRN